MRISVIIPAYNAEEYIATAIESCLRQTVLPDEIIVADDGSTDRTAAIAESYPEPVRVIRLGANCGVSVARNRAIEASTGDWLAFLDADDWFLPQKLEMQRQCIMDNPNAVLVYSAFRSAFPDGSTKDEAILPPGHLSWNLRWQGRFHAGSVMVRRDAFDAAGKFDPGRRRCEDWDLWLRVAERYSTDAFAAVPEPLSVYQRTPGSLTANLILMHEAYASIIDERSLYGLSGLSRTLLRRRIHAFHHFDTAIAVREQGSQEFLPFMLKSLRLWPLPGRMLPPIRYKMALVMILQHLGWWPNSFRTGKEVQSEHLHHSDIQHSG